MRRIQETINRNIKRFKENIDYIDLKRVDYIDMLRDVGNTDNNLLKQITMSDVFNNLGLIDFTKQVGQNDLFLNLDFTKAQVGNT